VIGFAHDLIGEHQGDKTLLDDDFRQHHDEAIGNRLMALRAAKQAALSMTESRTLKTALLDAAKNKTMSRGTSDLGAGRPKKDPTSTVSDSGKAKRKNADSPVEESEVPPKKQKHVSGKKSCKFPGCECRGKSWAQIDPCCVATRAVRAATRLCQK